MKAKAPTSAAKLGGLDAAAAPPIPEVSELRVLRAKESLESRLRDVGDVDKAVRIALRSAAELLGAEHRCLALVSPERNEASIESTGPGDPGPASWPAAALAQFARGEKPQLPDDVAVARLRRRRRPWGTAALRWPGRQPSWNTRHALTTLVALTNDHIERIEARRLAEVRARIDRKIIDQLRPKDLLYQVLDGLRSLTAYDHSGAVLLRIDDADEPDALELVAEQLAFRKGKSARIGARTSLRPALRASLLQPHARGFSRRAGRWEAWSPDHDATVATWLVEELPPIAADADAPVELIVSPLLASNELLGVLVLAARHERIFWPYECELVDALLPHALIALRNARHAESLEDQVIQSERKHAMADLARGVSHDVNNALGAVLPLVQQIRAEANEGRLDPAALRDDLASVEKSLHACVRIFNNMLLFARRAAEDLADATARLDVALDAVHAIHGDGFRRHAIALDRDLDAAIPPLPLRQAELEQVMLNLVANARDAVVAAGRGGGVSVVARIVELPDGGACVRIEVSDSGTGIEAAHLPRVLEPFYTTKPRGNGLGLAVCRSILWQARGRIRVDSPRRDRAHRAKDEAPGSTVTIEIPCRAGPAA